jgi:hypothetical protein
MKTRSEPLGFQTRKYQIVGVQQLPSNRKGELEPPEYLVSERSA